MKNKAQLSENADISTRLRKSVGHLEGIQKMIVEDRSCGDVLLQLGAVISSLSAVRVRILQSHLKGCVQPALKKGNEDLLIEIQSIIEKAIKSS